MMMLEHIDSVVTRSYSIPGGYVVDVEEWPEIYETWLYRVDYGFKMYMFGLPKDNEESRTLEQVLEIVGRNTMEYINTYKKIYPELEGGE